MAVEIEMIGGRPHLLLARGKKRLAYRIEILEQRPHRLWSAQLVPPDGRGYEVVWSVGGGWSCTCDSAKFKTFGSGRLECKHVSAARELCNFLTAIFLHEEVTTCPSDLSSN